MIRRGTEGDRRRTEGVVCNEKRRKQENVVVVGGWLRVVLKYYKEVGPYGKGGERYGCKRFSSKFRVGEGLRKGLGRVEGWKTTPD